MSFTPSKLALGEGSFIINSMFLRSKVEVITEKERRFVSEETSKHDKGQTSNSRASSHKSSIKIFGGGELSCHQKTLSTRGEEVKHVNERLRNLEEEIEAMKKDFLESTMERKQLMSDIYLQFQSIRSCCEAVHQDSGDYKGGRVGADGLSEILCKDSNTSQLIVRELRANAAQVFRSV